MLSTYLSIWEVAHRWHKVDPNKTDPQNLPFEVQDALRFLARAVLSGKVPLLDEVFTTDPKEGRYVKREHFVFEIEQIPSEFEACVNERKYDKTILDAYLISRIDLFRMTVFEGYPFPDFWFDDSILIALGGHVSEKTDPEPKAQNLANARTSVIDKSICQAVAKTLWDIYPNMNITRMTKHPSILKYGGGSNYLGKNTLRDWLREVAPEHLKNKPGRPKSTKSNNDKG